MESKDICAIIKAAKDSGLAKLAFGDLYLEFDNLTSRDESINNTNLRLYDSMDNNAPIIDPLDEVKESDLFAIKDEFAMANLMAEDPVAYENRLKENR